MGRHGRVESSTLDVAQIKEFGDSYLTKQFSIRALRRDEPEQLAHPSIERCASVGWLGEHSLRSLPVSTAVGSDRRQALQQAPRSVAIQGYGQYQCGSRAEKKSGHAAHSVAGRYHVRDEHDLSAFDFR